MKNKKGFTLIEVLAILVILAVILSIIIPTTLGIVSDSKSNLNSSQQKQLENAARMWYLDSNVNLEVDESCKISIKDIVDLEYLESNDVLDPKTGETMQGYIVITNGKEQYSYKYNETSSEENCIK